VKVDGANMCDRSPEQYLRRLSTKALTVCGTWKPAWAWVGNAGLCLSRQGSVETNTDAEELSAL